MVATVKKIPVKHLVSATLMITVAARDGHVEAIVTPTLSSAPMTPGLGWAQGRTPTEALLRGVLLFIEDVGLASAQQCETLRSALAKVEG